MFKNNTGGPPGDLVRIPFANPGQKQHIGGGRIPFPGGVVQGPDGAMYVTVNSASSTTNDGKVVRVSA
jgi:glucose/arabinose dehydrogenase